MLFCIGFLLRLPRQRFDVPAGVWTAAADAAGLPASSRHVPCTKARACMPPPHPAPPRCRRERAMAVHAGLAAAVRAALPGRNWSKKWVIHYKASAWGNTHIGLDLGGTGGAHWCSCQRLDRRGPAGRLHSHAFLPTCPAARHHDPPWHLLQSPHQPPPHQELHLLRGAVSTACRPAAGRQRGAPLCGGGGGLHLICHVRSPLLHILQLHSVQFTPQQHAKNINPGLPPLLKRPASGPRRAP